MQTVNGDELRKDVIQAEQTEESPFTQLQEAAGPEPRLLIGVQTLPRAAAPPPMFRVLSLVTTAIILTLILFFMLYITIRQKPGLIDYPPFPIANYIENDSIFRSSEVVDHPTMIVAPRKSWLSRISTMIEKLEKEIAGSLDEL